MRSLDSARDDSGGSGRDDKGSNARGNTFPYMPYMGESPCTYKVNVLCYVDKSYSALIRVLTIIVVLYSKHCETDSRYFCVFSVFSG